MASTTVVNVCRIPSGYLVHLEGRATRRESGAVQEFAAQALAEPTCNMVVDLSACSYLDSTFLGCLIGLQKMYERHTTSSFSIAAPSPACTRLLVAHHLDTFLHITDEQPDRLSTPVTIPDAVMDDDDLGEHIMECHRRLADVCEPNRLIYGPIADQLAKELDAKKRKDSP